MNVVNLLTTDACGETPARFLGNMRQNRYAHPRLLPLINGWNPF